MEFNRYTDVHAFYDDTYDILIQCEAQNMILLGNLMIGREGKDKADWRDPVNWVMATVSNARGIRLTALMTPPHNITLYATDNEVSQEAIDCLIDGLSGDPLPGVTTEKLLAESFALAYADRNKQGIRTSMRQRIYELKAVNTDVPQFGLLRLLEEKDMHFFPYWLEAFNASAVYGQTEMAIPHDAEAYRYRLSTKKIYVLEVDGQPVSMAGFTREMQTAIGVAFVYTPPYYRKKGFASSCVAQLSQLALDRGFSTCVLYTDLSNPVSNSIYRKIGYKPVCDSLMLNFE